MDQLIRTKKDLFLASEGANRRNRCPRTPAVFKVKHRAVARRYVDMNWLEISWRPFRGPPKGRVAQDSSREHLFLCQGWPVAHFEKSTLGGESVWQLSGSYGRCAVASQLIFPTLADADAWVHRRCAAMEERTPLEATQPRPGTRQVAPP